VRIQAICIGTELLTGHTVNTNLALMAEALDGCGYTVACEVCIPDELGVIRDTVRAGLAQADVVVTVGGLGPTCDDLTRPAVAEVLDAPLHFDAAIYRHIEEYLRRRNVPLRCEALHVQAQVPERATAIVNRNGTAPGLWCPSADGGHVVVMLPGPPREFGPMFLDDVLPRLRALAPPDVARRGLRVVGVPESIVEERVDRALAGVSGLTKAYCARPLSVDVRLSASPDRAAALDAALEALRAEFGPAALDAGEASVVASIGRRLRGRGWRLATAESCTGGGIAEAITAEAGSSEFFAGGIVCYANDWKTAQLGVRPQTLAAHGAVSPETAREMLDGLMGRTGVEAAIAVTGIAGPGGATPEKPVGLVYMAIGVRDRREVHCRQFPGNRGTVRDRAVATSLILLRNALQESDGAEPAAATPAG